MYLPAVTRVGFGLVVLRCMYLAAIIRAQLSLVALGCMHLPAVTRAKLGLVPLRCIHVLTSNTQGTVWSCFSSVYVLTSNNQGTARPCCKDHHTLKRSGPDMGCNRPLPSPYVDVPGITRVFHKLEEIGNNANIGREEAFPRRKHPLGGSTPWEEAPPGRKNPAPCGQNSWHTLLKILPCPKLRLLAVTKYYHQWLKPLNLWLQVQHSPFWANLAWTA